MVIENSRTSLCGNRLSKSQCFSTAC